MEPTEAQPITTQPVPEGGGTESTELLVGGTVVLVLVIGIMVAYLARRGAQPLPLPGGDAPALEDGGTSGPTEPPPADAEVADGGPQVAAPPTEGLLARFRTALDRSRSALQDSLQRVFGRPDDEEALQDLEDALLRADVGVPTASRLIEVVRHAARDKQLEGDALRQALRDEMMTILGGVPDGQGLETSAQPYVLLVVGVNGSGKTTTIGKLSHRFRSQNKRVMLAAGDTFRAAAAEQLEVWAQRTGADITRADEGADPGSVVFQALERAQAQGHDVVIVDTAGRLQTRKPLMEQLAKIRRVIQKRVPDGPHDTLLVLDGTIGQNGMSQAQLFHEATPLTGVAVTKLDGTARGGMILAIAAELGLPVRLVGLGEQAEDLRDFEASAFVDALL